jgi:hypothetical protein
MSMYDVLVNSLYLYHFLIQGMNVFLFRFDEWVVVPSEMKQQL